MTPLIPKSYIKNIAIEIDPDYTLENSPYSFEDDQPKNKIFIGREKNQDKLKELLLNEKGVYLVTGYRGMGKTSFVNKSIKELKEEVKANDKNLPKQKRHGKFYPIDINLSQNELNEFDILRLMVSKIYTTYFEVKNIFNKERTRKFVRRFLAYSIVILLAALLILLFKAQEFNNFLSLDFGRIKWIPYPSKTLKYLILGILAGCIYLGIRQVYLHFFRRKEDKIYQALKTLLTRCYSNVVKEQGSEYEAVLETLNTRISGPQEKEIQNFPIASAKEIEFELTNILEKINDNSKIKFIFIFDELDKVEPAVVTTTYYQDIESFEKSRSNTYLDQLRNRKQAVLNIISGLKNFLTTARSNFIFIAGREMFDASLADIADRQSSVSSMFNYVFYIDSLLKENVELNNTASLSTSIEKYLELILFPETEQQNKNELFKKLSSTTNLDELDKDEKALHISKIITIIQNFIIYLTYRSNGSPKKMIRSIHEFIRVENPNDDQIINDRTGTLILLKQEKLKEGNSENNSKRRKYLYFNYQDQYRIGFINYLYRPFLIRYGRSLKEYSDSIIVATPYLFDHLLKFHPFAFSLTNLELIPEVLATTKTPTLKDHIKVIIDYLSHNHIRETEIGLFDYKFYSRTLNELSFISRTFEEEGAAFNFTLDESYLVKLHVRSKIKELRSIYSKYTEKAGSDSQMIYSISYLNSMLGDLHFFDEEYDDAIIAYSDAIKPINSLEIHKLNMRDFIALIRNKLKLGLCFEKINSYEESLAFYTDASQDAKRFIIYNISRGKYLSPLPEPDTFELNGFPITFYSSSLSDILQIINQAFLAKLIVQEKLGVEGITANKIAISCGGFLRLSEHISKHCGKNHLIHANFYLMLGNILYFKNDNYIDQGINESSKKIPPVTFDLWKKILELTTIKNVDSKDVEDPRKPTPIIAACF